MKDEPGIVESLKFKFTLQEAVDIVWDAWTKTEKIIEWFSPEANLDARLGGAFELFFDPENHGHQSTKGCKITVFNPLKTLAFTWKGPDEFGNTMNNPCNLTSVSVDFEAINGTTQLKVEHSGWDARARLKLGSGIIRYGKVCFPTSNPCITDVFFINRVHT